MNTYFVRWFCASHRFIWSQPNQQDSHNDFLLYQLQAAPCLVGFLHLFGWKFCLERSSFVGTRIMSKKSNTVRNLRIRAPSSSQTWVSGIWRWEFDEAIHLVMSYLLRWKVFYPGMYFWGPSHTSSASWDWMSRVIFRPRDGESCPWLNLIESFSESFPSQVEQVWLFLKREHVIPRPWVIYRNILRSPSASFIWVAKSLAIFV